MAFSDNKKIVKNTVLLYVRMLLLMAVSFYTSRVILDTLGVDDYGIYNLIGGFITLFSFISSALVSAIQRYFNVALGHRDDEQFKRIYSMGIMVFVMFSAFLLLVGETVGLWFVQNKLNIPAGRETAAMWVYQVSILTLIIHLFRTTDNVAIIAYEKMGFYAYLSIGEALLKLGIVFLLSVGNVDKLILYVILYCVATLLINIAYKLYCNRVFTTCRFKFIWDKGLFKELLTFSGWNVLTSGTHVLTNQGNAFFLNHYYSVAVNAAQGVAGQVYNAVNNFLTNFQVAFKPQIVKTYAAGEMENHYNLVFRAAKLSLYLMLALVVPIVFNLEGLLNIWLVDVPQYTREFCLFVLLAYVMDSIGAPLGTSIFANGNIKGVQIWQSVLYVAQLVACFFLLRAKFPPYIVSVSVFVVHALFVVIYMVYGKLLCNISLRRYSFEVLLPGALVTVCSLIVPYVIRHITGNIWVILCICAVDCLWTMAVAFFVGMKKEEKQFVLNLLTSRLKKK